MFLLLKGNYKDKGVETMKKKYKVVGTSNRKADAKIQAKQAGWRGSGKNKYFENRANRCDKGKWL